MALFAIRIMDTKELFLFLLIAIGGYILLPLLSVTARAQHETFVDSTADNLHSGLGTIEFRVQLLKDLSIDPHTHALLLGTPSDAEELYYIVITENKLIARRYFGHCLLTAFSSSYDFKTGDWHRIKMTWNNASTKFYIDDKEVPRVALLSGDDLFKARPGIRLGHENGSYATEGLQVSDHSDIPIDDSDRKFLLTSSCPRLGELVNGPVQEEYEGIKLQHFPDQKSIDKIKSYIALLPEDFAHSIKHVVYVEDARAPKTGEGGEAIGESMSVILKGSYFDDPNVFFHEATHVYDFKLHIAMGVPDDKNEWAAISGVTCYFKGADMEGFYKKYERNHVQDAFLTPQGGQCSFEDLAIWVGAAYDYYLKNESMVKLLTPGGPKYSPKNKQKLDFLLRKGFIRQEVYDKLTSAK
jgi:hypothetical protein